LAEEKETQNLDKDNNNNHSIINDINENINYSQGQIFDLLKNKNTIKINEPKNYLPFIFNGNKKINFDLYKNINKIHVKSNNKIKNIDSIIK
jgi:hypothetical protein